MVDIVTILKLANFVVVVIADGKDCQGDDDE